MKRILGPIIALLISGILVSIGAYYVLGSPGNAEFWRTRNYTPSELLREMNADFFRIRNYLPSELSRTMNTDVTRLRNYQASELNRTMNADLMKLRNFQAFELRRSMNADTTKLRNYESLELRRTMNVDVMKIRNYETFEMNQTGPMTVTISSFTTVDQSMNPKSSFTPGGTVFFKIVISCNGSQNIQNALVSVMVQDPNLTPTFLSYTYQNIEIGKYTTAYLGTQIPYDSILGDHTAKVNVFTMLPSQGGQPIIGGHAEAHFSVN